MTSVYDSISEVPSASAVVSAQPTRLSNLLFESSNGRYGKDTVILFLWGCEKLKRLHLPEKSLERKHIIKLIQKSDAEIEEIECEMKTIMEEIRFPIFTINV